MPGVGVNLTVLPGPPTAPEPVRIVEEALPFDDVLLQPAFSEVLPRDVDLATRLTTDIDVQLPLVSAAMDTVTEARLAIAIAQEGGLGVVHKNMSAQLQAERGERAFFPGWRPARCGGCQPGQNPDYKGLGGR